MDSSGLTPLRLSQKQVLKMPMDQLWTDAELLPAIRKENLITAQVRDLLGKGSIQFVIASCGDKLVWVPINTCYDFFKSELSIHLVDNPDYIVWANTKVNTHIWQADGHALRFPL